MTTITTFPLRDGSITGKSRADIVALMAADLARFDAWHTEADAIRTLVARRVYASFDIMRLVDDARQVVVQSLVAREMASS